MLLVRVMTVTMTGTFKPMPEGNVQVIWTAVSDVMGQAAGPTVTEDDGPKLEPPITSGMPPAVPALAGVTVLMTGAWYENVNELLN